MCTTGRGYRWEEPPRHSYFCIFLTPVERSEAGCKEAEAPTPAPSLRDCDCSLIEPEAATAKVQHARVGAAAPDSFLHDIQALPPMFFDVEQTCFPQDT